MRSHFAASGAKSVVSLDSDAIKPFAHEFVRALKNARFEKVVGLSVYPHPGFRGGLEITRGRVNVTLSPGEVVHCLLPHPILQYWHMTSGSDGLGAELYLRQKHSAFLIGSDVEPQSISCLVWLVRQNAFAMDCRCPY
jgi:hypothetical protein